MQSFRLASTAFIVATQILLLTNVSAEQSDVIDTDKDPVERKIVVTAEFTETNVLELPASVTVIDQQIIRQRNAQHFSDLLNLAPNVNFATGASRGRFVQIRGIGERSEFSEPVNYSVGVVVDGIDLTGIASAATLSDIQQVEVLRGPQGTLYGANGLAGLINIVSNAPTDQAFVSLRASAESYSGFSAGAVVSGPASDKLGYRFSLNQYQSDGYMKNIYLNRDDTNNLDELSLRGKLVYQANEKLSITTSLLIVDIDNGYDAFSLDSNRNTYSDQPGYDRQKTKAVSFDVDWELANAMRLESIVSLTQSDLQYAFDEDWSHTGICDDLACDSDLAGFDWWYSSFDRYQRENNNHSIDLRLHSDSNIESTSWVVGLHYRDQQMDLQREYTYRANNYLSDFTTTNQAIYGQMTNQLNTKFSITSGLRFENRRAKFSDNEAANFTPSENLWGGKLALEYQLDRSQMLYALISRGYKNGGFNANNAIPIEEREYATEYMWNYEGGIKGNWFDNQLMLQASVFYQDRDDVQIKQSLVRSIADGRNLLEGGECPCSFTDYTVNATQTASYGIELEATWQANDQLQVYSTLGLLKTEFKDFASFTHAEADLTVEPPIPYQLDGRATAHSPKHQLVLGAQYFISDNWMINPEIEAKGAFYFSDRHNAQSDSYQIANLRATYLQDNWQVSLYVNNLTDEDIETRGFGSFGNDPRKFYEVENYYQFAAPRIFGVSASINFE